MPNWQQITRDFRQRFQGSYIQAKLVGQKDKEIFYLGAVQETSGPPQLTLNNLKYGNIILRYDTDAEIYFDFPPVGYFTFFYQAVILFKTHLRQWNRGLSPSTAIITTPYSIWNPYVQVPWSFQMVEAVFAPFKTSTILDAKTQLNQMKALSVPLTKEFALGLDVRNTNKYLLWHYEICIGELIKDTVVLAEQAFAQEFKDYLRDTGQGTYGLN